MVLVEGGGQGATVPNACTREPAAAAPLVAPRRSAQSLCGLGTGAAPRRSAPCLLWTMRAAGKHCRVPEGDVQTALLDIKTGVPDVRLVNCVVMLRLPALLITRTSLLFQNRFVSVKSHFIQRFQTPCRFHL